MDYVFAPQLVFGALILRLAIKKITRIDIEVVLGTFLYFLGLVAGRMLRGIGHGVAKSYRSLTKVKSPVVKIKKEVHTVADINSVYRLRGLEVILGFDRTGRPIRFDLDSHHTLIGGTSGWGKTTMLNGIIAQLVTRPYFREEYDLYLLDLKSSKYDYLTLWKPVIAGYYAIDEKGSAEQAIQALEDIAEKMHRQDTGRRILIIIDELAMLTSQATDSKMRQRGRALLQRLAAQIRDRGSILAATQRVHYEVIDRMVAANMDRKICMHVDDNNDGKLVMRFKPNTDCTTLKVGEFVLKEPGSKHREQVGRTLPMVLPNEIDVAVSTLIELNADNDDRIKIYRMACSTLNQGDDLPGVNNAFWKKSGFGVETIRTAYRNFHHAGATVARVDKRGQPNVYLLAVDFMAGYKLLQAYIQEGSWQAAPGKIGGNDEQHGPFGIW